LALFAAYVTFTGIDGINIFKAPVLAMLFGRRYDTGCFSISDEPVGKAAYGHGV
jgi:K(+)-stimulated pyrophosphate-energized sodium pump